MLGRIRWGLRRDRSRPLPPSWRIRTFLFSRTSRKLSLFRSTLGEVKFFARMLTCGASPRSTRRAPTHMVNFEKLRQGTPKGGHVGKKVKPKKKCCESKNRCKRCPLRMLKEGTLPKGYTVKHRKLVKLAA